MSQSLPFSGTAAASPAASLQFRFVVRDPERGDWLTVTPDIRSGLSLWLVDGHHESQAHAERAAGFHASPIFAWLLYDPTRGWRLASGPGWVPHVTSRCQMPEAAARAIAGDEQQILRVWRTDGRITCPNVEAGRE